MSYRFARTLAWIGAAALLTACPQPPQPDPVNDEPVHESEVALPDSSVLRVAALYSEEEVQLRFEYQNDQPIWYHRVLVYEDGEWVRHGSGSEGPDPYGLYEDRISVMWDDGSVEGFANQGGYVITHPGMRSTASEADADQVREHPWLGEELGRSDVRKFILESRSEGVEAEEAWREVRSAAELEQLREEGVFLDLWQWRAHRSNPMGYADNGYVLDYRHSSSGRGMYTDNQDDETGLPLMMYDPEKTGRRAWRFEDFKQRKLSQDDLYYLTEEFAVPFDPDADWENGDALPHRLLREPEGSRGAIRADGRHEEGAWRVRLTRSREAPDPLDSKSFEEGTTYFVAFAVHEGGTGARHHLVSMPVTFTLGEGGRIEAQKVDGPLDEADAEFHEIPLFDPGDPTAF